MIVGGLVIAQLLVRIYLQIWPKITPPRVAFLLDSRFRRRYRDPERTLAPLALRNGQTVLEIGAGTGIFTGTAARCVAPNGRLIAIELQRGMLYRLARRTQADGLHNLLLQQADVLALPLASRSIDVAYMIAVLPMVPDKQQALREVWRVLKPDGLLAVSEELIAPEYVPPAVTRSWGKRAGFVATETLPGFWSYMVLFRKAAPAD